MSLIRKTSVRVTLTLSEGHNCQERFAQHCQSEENSDGSGHDPKTNQTVKLNRFVPFDLEAC